MASGASALAQLLDGSTAGELIPELVRQVLQQLIELEFIAVLGAVFDDNLFEGRIASLNGLPA
jgi:putative transposase